MARLSERRGQADQAERLYREIIQRYPDDPAGHHRLAVICCQGVRYQEAEEHFAQALKLTPDDPELLADYGYLCYLSSRYQDAERHLRRAVDLKPMEPRYCNNLALVLGELGRDEECRSYFQRADPSGHDLLNYAFVLAQRGEYQRAMAIYDRALTEDPRSHAAADAMVELSKHVPHSLPQTVPAPYAPAGGPSLAWSPAPAVAPGNPSPMPQPAPRATYPPPNNASYPPPNNAPPALAAAGRSPSILPSPAPQSVQPVSYSLPPLTNYPQLPTAYPVPATAVASVPAEYSGNGAAMNRPAPTSGWQPPAWQPPTIQPQPWQPTPWAQAGQPQYQPAPPPAPSVSQLPNNARYSPGYSQPPAPSVYQQQRPIGR